MFHQATYDSVMCWYRRWKSHGFPPLPMAWHITGDIMICGKYRGVEWTCCVDDIPAFLPDLSDNENQELIVQLEHLKGAPLRPPAAIQDKYKYHPEAGARMERAEALLIKCLRAAGIDINDRVVAAIELAVVDMVEAEIIKGT